MITKRILLALTIALISIPAIAQDAGWIGVVVEDETDSGAVIRRLERNGPAERAGLREGDVITAFNKQDVLGALQLTRLVRETPPGRTAEVNVRRDNQEQTFQLTTARLPARRFWPNIPDSATLRDQVIRAFPRVQVTTSYSESGVQVEQLTDQLRDYFGVSGKEGVLVASVDPDSAAGREGVKAGDVIIGIDGKSVATPAEFLREMRAATAGSQRVLKIVRDKQEREITISF